MVEQGILNSLDVGSIPTPPTNAFVAQLGEQGTLNSLVVGSSPTKSASEEIMICSECGNDATFKINGRIKSDKEHTLCTKCYKSLVSSNVQSKEGLAIVDWEDKDTIFAALALNSNVLIYPPKNEDEIKGMVCHIKISDNDASAYISLESEDWDFPSLMYSWKNNTALAFIQHWLWQILDMPQIAKVESIKIKALGDWRHRIQ